MAVSFIIKTIFKNSPVSLKNNQCSRIPDQVPHLSASVLVLHFLLMSHLLTRQFIRKKSVQTLISLVWDCNVCLLDVRYIFRYKI